MMRDGNRSYRPSPASRVFAYKALLNWFSLFSFSFIFFIGKGNRFAHATRKWVKSIMFSNNAAFQREAWGRGILVFIAAILFSAAFTGAALAADGKGAAAAAAAAAEKYPVNITADNRVALAEAVDMAQHFELHRISRGRVRPNPIIFPLHTIYQVVMQDQDYLLRRHRDVYENALMRMQQVMADYGDVAAGKRGAELMAAFNEALLDSAVLRKRLEEQDTALGIWRVLEGSRMEMEMLPVRAGMAFNALKWLGKFYGGNIPDDVYGEFRELSGLGLEPKNIIEIESSTAKLAMKYSEFMSRVSDGWTPARSDANPEGEAAR